MEFYEEWTYLIGQKIVGQKNSRHEFKSVKILVTRQ